MTRINPYDHTRSTLFEMRRLIEKGVAGSFLAEATIDAMTSLIEGEVSPEDFRNLLSEITPALSIPGDDTGRGVSLDGDFIPVEIASLVDAIPQMIINISYNLHPQVVRAAASLPLDAIMNGIPLDKIEQGERLREAMSGSHVGQMALERYKIR